MKKSKQYATGARSEIHGMPVTQFLRKLDSWCRKNPEKRTFEGSEIDSRLRLENRKMELMKKVNALSKRDASPDELMKARRELRMISEHMRLKYETC